MIHSPLHSAEQPQVKPSFLPECFPAKAASQSVHVPKPVLELVEFAKPTITIPSTEPGLCLPFTSEDLPLKPFCRLPSEVQAAQMEVVAKPFDLAQDRLIPNRIVEILELGYGEFEQNHPLPGYVREAARMALYCRTSALGGHVERCPCGHVEKVWYNSCGHRFCPRCAYRKQQEWLKKERKRILPVRHVHATFTIPREFNELWWCNFKEMAALLFHTSAQALRELLKDPQRVGVEIGISSALHTWDDRMRRHPHLHCLVTAGGLTPEGEWKDSYRAGDKPFLVRVEPLMQRFRSLFCRRLAGKIKKARLKLPEGCSKQQVLNMINTVNRRAWQVHIQKPPEDGGPTTEQILAYQAKAVAGGPVSAVRIEGIARKVAEWSAGIRDAQESQMRYISEPPISEGRVEEVDPHSAQVTFCWGKYDRQSGRRARDNRESVSVEECIRRLLFHVTPPNFQAIRHYGLYTSAKKKEREQLRAILPDVAQAQDEQSTGVGHSCKHGSLERVALEDSMDQRTRCPVCGKRLVFSNVIPSSLTGKLSPRDKAKARLLRKKRRRRRGS